MDKRLKAALKESFTPPPAQQRERFISGIPYPRAKFSAVLCSQIAFIRKRVWLAFFAVVAAAFVYTSHAQVPGNIVGGLSALLPLVSLCTVTELYKSVACNMAEMELACRYDLSKITFMRLGILGTATFFVLLCCVALAGKNEFGALRNALYLGVPYLLSSYLSVAVLSKCRGKETIYVCGAISGAVSIGVALANSSGAFLYHTDFTGIWAVALVVLGGLLALSVAKFQNAQEELQWSL